MLPSTFAEYTGRPKKYLALHFANEIWKNNTAELYDNNKVVSPDSWIRFAYYQDQVDLGYVIDVAKESPQYGKLLEAFYYKETGWHYFYQKPIMDQYLTWIKNIVTKWNWGTSTVIEPNSSAIHIIF